MGENTQQRLEQCKKQFDSSDHGKKAQERYESCEAKSPPNAPKETPAKPKSPQIILGI